MEMSGFNMNLFDRQFQSVFGQQPQLAQNINPIPTVRCDWENDDDWDESDYPDDMDGEEDYFPDPEESDIDDDMDDDEHRLDYINKLNEQ